VLDECFLDMPSFLIHPQTLTMETIWVSKWIERVLKKHKESSEEGHLNDIYIADRSPYSAVFYAKKNGHLLEPLIKAQIEELESMVDIRIITVLVDVETEILWKRILERLERETFRLKYNEDSREWMETTLEFYRSKERKWDFRIENNSNIVCEVMNKLISTLCVKVDKFSESYSDYSSVC